jgi:hypothetical protein
VNTNSTQDGREEVIHAVEFEGQVVILFPNCRDVLGGTGVDRTGAFTTDILFEPALVRDLDAKPILISFIFQ